METSRVRRLLAIVIALGGLATASCQSEAPREPTSATDPSRTEPEQPSDPPSDEPQDEPPQASPEPAAPETDPKAPQTLSCTSQKDGNKSVADITYVVSNGNVAVASMVVTVTNKNQRNKNDVDVYITPSGGTEAHQFNSGDIVQDATPTTIPLPANFGTTVGSRIRVETNFDDSFGDPAASCYLQF